MRMRCVTALFIAASAVATACNGGDEPRPTETPGSVSPTAAATPAPTQQPTPPLTPQPGIARTYPLAGSNELFAYTVGTGFEDSGNRRYPRRTVVVQDLATGKLLTTLEYSGKLGNDPVFPVGVVLAGRQLVVATESALTRYELDGSKPLQLLEVPRPQAIADLAVSPDGRIVAVTSNCQLACIPENAVTFYEVPTGRLMKQVKQSSPAFVGFTGDVWQLSWSGDSRGVWVTGATYSEGGGGRAFVSVAGDVRTYDPGDWGFTTFSPSGRYLAEGVPQIGCMRVGGRALRVTDMEAGAVVANISGEQGVYAAWEWSPDSKELAFQFIPGDGSTCTLDEGALEYRLYSVADGTVAKMQSMESLHRRWYGDHLVETVCEDARPDEPILSRYGYNAVCRVPGAGEAVGDVFVGGKKVASWPLATDRAGGGRIEPLGFLPK